MMNQVHGDVPSLPVPSVLSKYPQLLLTPAWGISQSKELLSLFPCTLSCIWGGTTGDGEHSLPLWRLCSKNGVVSS